MASLNKVMLMGNITRDLELRYTPNGAAVCDMSLAINRRFGGEGQEREETTFVDIVVWNKQAETCSRYLKKGSACFVEGRLQLDTWDDRETGKKRSRLRVVAERVQFLNGRPEGQQFDGQNNYQQPQQAPGGFGQAPAQQPYQAQQVPPMPQAAPQPAAPAPQQPAFQQPQAAPAPVAQPQAPVAQPQAPVAQPVPQVPQQQPVAPQPQAPAMPDAFNVENSVEDDIPF